MNGQTYDSLSSPSSLIVTITIFIFIALVVLLILHRAFCIWSGLSTACNDLLDLDHQLSKNDDQKNEKIIEEKKNLHSNVEQINENGLTSSICVNANQRESSKANQSFSSIRRFSSSSGDSDSSFISAHCSRTNVLDSYDYELELDRLTGDLSCFPGAAYGS